MPEVKSGEVRGGASRDSLGSEAWKAIGAT